jgi:putative addiction module antidote
MTIMAIEAKVRKIGSSLGIVLPKEVLQSMKVEEGSSLYLTEAPKCSIQIHAEKPHFKKKMEASGDIMRRYRNTFRELAE